MFFLMMALYGMADTLDLGLVKEEPKYAVYGAGATSAYELYSVWSAYYESYRSPFETVKVTYYSRGSSTGKEMLKKGLANFAGLDEPLTEMERNTTDLRQYPCFAWILVLAYNVPGLKNLTLTREQIVGIYNRTISNWNDSILSANNDPRFMPNATIVPMARFDSSGSTNIFTKALSSFDSRWKAEFGIFSERTGWKNLIKDFGERVTGLADALKNKRYSIGYLTASGAQEVSLEVALIINRSNRKIRPNLDSLLSTVEPIGKSLAKTLYDSVVDLSFPEAYPFVSLSYVSVNVSVSADDCKDQMEAYRFLDWTMASKEAKHSAMTLGLIPLGNLIYHEVHAKVFLSMTCNGQAMDGPLRLQIYYENESLKTWKIPVIVSAHIVAVVFFGIIFYTCYQRHLYSKMLNKKLWKINFYDVNLIAKTCSHKNNSSAQEDQTLSEESENLMNSMPSYCIDEQLGVYDGSQVSLRCSILNESNFKNTRKLSGLLLSLVKISHPNLSSFVGLAFSPTGDMIFVEEYCSRGPVIDLLISTTIEISQSICFAVCRDICSALSFLHSKDIVVGLLQLCSCVVDSRWTVKICGWEALGTFRAIFGDGGRPFAKLTSKVSGSSHMLNTIKLALNVAGSGENRRRLYFDLWLAPEIVSQNCFGEPTKKTDVYSFGVIMLVIFYKFHQRFGVCALESHDDIDTVLINKLEYFDKKICCHKIPPKVCNLINLCCDGNPSKRPNFDALISTLNSCDSSPNLNVLDHIVNHYEKVSANPCVASAVDVLVE